MTSRARSGITSAALLWMLVAMAVAQATAAQSSSAPSSSTPAAANPPADGATAVTDGAALPGRGLVVRFFEVEPSLEDRLLEARGIQASSPSVDRVAASAPRFIDPLRARFIPARQAAAAVDLEACRPGNSIPALLEEASRAIDFVELEAAARLLTRVRLVFACGPAFVSTGDLGRLLFLEAVLQTERGQSAGARMADALAVSPFLPYPSDYGDGVRKAFEAAQHARALVPRVPVDIRAEALEDLVLAVDGIQTLASQVTVPEGVHFLQVLTRGGRAVAGAEVRLSAEAGTPPVWPPAELLPPRRLELVQRLQGDVAEGRLSTAIGAALRDVIEEGGYGWIALMAVASDDARAPRLRSLWVDRGKTIQAASLALRPGSSRPRAGLYGALSLGAASLLSGGLAGYTYHLGATTVFPDTSDGHDAADALLRNNRLANGGWITGLTGAVATAGLSWIVQGRPRAAEAPGGATALTVALEPGGVQIEW